MIQVVRFINSVDDKNKMKFVFSSKDTLRWNLFCDVFRVVVKDIYKFW